MNNREQFRLIVFKRLIIKNNIYSLMSSSDEELLLILNSAVIPNSISLNAYKMTYYLGKLFTHGERERKRLKSDILHIDKLYENTSQSERTLLRFGIFKGFLTSSWRGEMFRYINEPIGNNNNYGGKKIIYSKKFQEIFYFVYNVISRGEVNGRFPKF